METCAPLQFGIWYPVRRFNGTNCPRSLYTQSISFIAFNRVM